MCMPNAVSKVQELVDDAVLKGAKLVVGGKTIGDKGQFYAPTILAGVTSEMRIWNEEVFGPVMLVTKFENDEEAVQLANDSQFGLGASVWCNNQTRAVRLGSQVECGMFAVNDFASNALCQSLPFGGVKESGFDRFYGVEGLRGMCNVKAVCIDRFPWLMRTEIPEPLQYPVNEIGFEFVRALSFLFYGSGIWGPIKGISSILSLLMFGKQKVVEEDDKKSS
eukprot:TRINITY_DN23578_c0_g1_i4.p2 TRINITY_DN23578_c0_g1~~TRINITY_DN23578_c0_g1_i4.p2  ORF type:complete len:243 (+),score=50.66 TRINITY_DN23578_c0_g1_i4:66-731(+)